MLSQFDISDGSVPLSANRPLLSVGKGHGMRSGR